MRMSRHLGVYSAAEKKYAITVTVTGEGAALVLSGPTGGSKTLSAPGSYTFADLKVGTYTIKATGVKSNLVKTGTVVVSHTDGVDTYTVTIALFDGNLYKNGALSAAYGAPTFSGSASGVSYKAPPNLGAYHNAAWKSSQVYWNVNLTGFQTLVIKGSTTVKSNWEDPRVVYVGAWSGAPATTANSAAVGTRTSPTAADPGTVSFNYSFNVSNLSGNYNVGVAFYGGNKSPATLLITEVTLS